METVLPSGNSLLNDDKYMHRIVVRVILWNMLKLLK